MCEEVGGGDPHQLRLGLATSITPGSSSSQWTWLSTAASGCVCVYLFLTSVLVCSFFCVLTLSLLQEDTSPPPSARTGLLQAGDSLGTPQGHQKRGGAQREGSTAVVSPPGTQSHGQPQGTWAKHPPRGLGGGSREGPDSPCSVSCLKVKGTWHCLSAPPRTGHGVDRP